MTEETKPCERCEKEPVHGDPILLHGKYYALCGICMVALNSGLQHGFVMWWEGRAAHRKPLEEDTKQLRIEHALREAMLLAARTDLQYAVLVAQGVVLWSSMALTGRKIGEPLDPEHEAAFDALQKLLKRLAAEAAARGGEPVQVLVPPSGNG